MSTSANELKEASLVPGAFPDEIPTPAGDNVNRTLTSNAQPAFDGAQDAKVKDFKEQQRAAHTGAGGSSAQSAIQDDAKVREFKQQQHAAHTAGDNNVGFSSGYGSQDAKLREFKEQQDAAHTAGQGNGVANTTPPTTRRDEYQTQNLDTPNIGQDLSSMASGLATAATAVGLAARDAAVAAKDAAIPAASAAADQARSVAGYASENAGPAATTARDSAGSVANSASQQAGSAATYAKESAYSVANTAQAYAPNALGGSTSTDASRSQTHVDSSVPSQVKSSISQAGAAPEAAASSEAVHNKQNMEGELLHQVEPQGAVGGSSQGRPREPVSAPSGDYEDELAPSTQTPGVVKVLSTEKARSFPLGANHHENDNASADTANEFEPAFTTGGNGTPQVSNGLGTVATDALSQGTGAAVDTSNQRLMRHAEDVGVGAGSSDDRMPSARHAPPVEDKLPTRTTEEVALDNAPGVYKTLSSGTPSGVQL